MCCSFCAVFMLFLGWTASPKDEQPTKTDRKILKETGVSKKFPRCSVVFKTKKQETPFTSVQFQVGRNGLLGDPFGRDVTRDQFKKNITQLALEQKEVAFILIADDPNLPSDKLRAVVDDVTDVLPDDAVAIIYVVFHK